MPSTDLTTLLRTVGTTATTAFTKGGWSRVAVIATAVLATAVVVAGVMFTGVLSPSTGDPDAGDTRQGPAAPASDCYTKAIAGRKKSTTGGAKAEPETVAEAKVAVDCLPVKALAPAEGYTRAQFGSPWTDKAENVSMAGNGCNTRDDILARDMTNLDITGDCQIESGTLADPYTGKTIRFVRGPATSGAVQIDHLVALKNAWQSGAQDLTAAQRTSLANDPINLLAADGPANGGKGAKSADQWLPAHAPSHCGYVASQVRVKNRYHLWVTAPEKATMKKVLATCLADM